MISVDHFEFSFCVRFLFRDWIIFLANDRIVSSRLEAAGAVLCISFERAPSRDRVCFSSSRNNTAEKSRENFSTGARVDTRILHSVGPGEVKET